MFNTDMLMIHDAVKVLVEFLERTPGAAACAGRLRNRDMTSQVSYGSFPSFTEALVRALFLGRLFPRADFPHPGKIPPEHVREPFEAEYLSGADMCIRKSVVDAIGFFDERYTSYCEETDFCYRVLHETPYKLYVVPAAETIHFGGASFAHVSEYRLRLQYSSYDKFFRKHHGVLYSFATRALYAWQYAVRWAGRAAGYVRRRTPEDRALMREASWHVRYALFPTEERI
jgi:GT2 family glycosyltransferase